jgi:hypothetical protein
MHVRGLFDALAPFVTDTIWIGKMNEIRRRAAPGTDLAAIAAIEARQTNEAVRWVYDLLRNEPKVRWKESYKEVLGLPASTEAGLDR